MEQHESYTLPTLVMEMSRTIRDIRQNNIEVHKAREMVSAAKVIAKCAEIQLDAAKFLSMDVPPQTFGLLEESK